MLNSMFGRRMARPQLPSGAPPANMGGSGDIHGMVRQAMQFQPQGGAPMQAPQPQMQPPAQPLMNPRNAMMGKILRG